jgi:hypothetical protein
LNIRSGAGKNYPVVGGIAKGEKVCIDTTIFGWGKVVINGQVKGYASMKYLATDFKYQITDYVSLDILKKYWWIASIIIWLMVSLLVFSNSGDSSKTKTKIISRRTNTNNERAPILYWWQCQKCFNQPIKQSSKPSEYIRCPSDKTYHYWKKLAEVGEVNFSCNYCGLIIMANSKPSEYMRCPGNNPYHYWKKV